MESWTTHPHYEFPGISPRLLSFIKIIDCVHFVNKKSRRGTPLHLPNRFCKTILARTTWTNSSERKPDLVVEQEQQYKITLKTEGKADRTAKGWAKIIVTPSCSISLAFNFK